MVAAPSEGSAGTRVWGGERRGAGGQPVGIRAWRRGFGSGLGLRQ